MRAEFKSIEELKPDENLPATPNYLCLKDFLNSKEVQNRIPIHDKFFNITRHLHLNDYGNVKFLHYPILANIEDLLHEDECKKIIELIKDSTWEKSTDFSTSKVTTDKLSTAESLIYNPNPIVNKPSALDLYFNSWEWKCLLNRVKEIFSNVNDGNDKMYVKFKRYLKENGSDKVGINLHKDVTNCTLVLYLNTLNKGGETVFPFMNKMFKAEAGQALLFKSSCHVLNNETYEIVYDDALLHGAYPLLDEPFKYIIQFMTCDDKPIKKRKITDDRNKIEFYECDENFFKYGRDFPIVSKKARQEKCNIIEYSKDYVLYENYISHEQCLTLIKNLKKGITQLDDAMGLTSYPYHMSAKSSDEISFLDPLLTSKKDITTRVYIYDEDFFSEKDIEILTSDAEQLTTVSKSYSQETYDERFILFLNTASQDWFIASSPLHLKGSIPHMEGCILHIKNNSDVSSQRFIFDHCKLLKRPPGKSYILEFTAKDSDTVKIYTIK